jgi:leucine dehydrogenase
LWFIAFSRYKGKKGCYVMIFRDFDRKFLGQNSSFDHHEIVRLFELGGTERKAIIAVHNANLGPALGGCRYYPYADDMAALTDVLRLSRGMTYKNAMAGLPLGGGKSVIIGNPRQDKSEEQMEEMGEAVESLAGKYVTAEDSGTTEEDMLAMSRRTRHVTGLPPDHFEGKDFGELGGNPSPLTALGVYNGLRAAVHHRYGGNSLTGLKVAVQGVGAVGFELCKLLKQDGVELYLTDVDSKRLADAREALGAGKIVAPDEIYDIEAEVFAPCALGGVLNDITIPKLKAQIVAGAANNQLLTAQHDLQLLEKNILYVPDYVLNAGGVICVAYEYFRKSGYNPLDFDITRESMVMHVERIGQTVRDVLSYATAHKLGTGEAADRLAEEKFIGGKPLDVSSESPPSFGPGGGRTLVQ